MTGRNVHGVERGQQGALLILTLVILLVISLLGMATMDTTGLEMKMASNNRDQQQAFEAAEYTLSWVENQISQTVYSNESLSDSSCGSTCFEPTCSNGYCFDGSNPLDWANCQLNSPAQEVYEEEALWQDGSGRHRTLVVPATGITAKYIIEFRCYTGLDSATPMSVTNFAQLYRITAFATGAADRGRVMLRSTTKKL
ncbi:MAG: PilX N-terminal domain-containing pilus assembly protein [Pseudomonadales bacterium]|nr:PilX N-terminal domain-containing pilus assembly protein [Pseudomonadales bacterium]